MLVRHNELMTIHKYLFDYETAFCLHKPCSPASPILDHFPCPQFRLQNLDFFPFSELWLTSNKVKVPPTDYRNYVALCTAYCAHITPCEALVLVSFTKLPSPHPINNIRSEIKDYHLITNRHQPLLKRTFRSVDTFLVCHRSLWDNLVITSIHYLN